MNWKLIECDDPGSSNKFGPWPRDGTTNKGDEPVLIGVKALGKGDGRQSA